MVQTNLRIRILISLNNNSLLSLSTSNKDYRIVFITYRLRSVRLKSITDEYEDYPITKFSFKD